MQPNKLEGSDADLGLELTNDDLKDVLMAFLSHDTASRIVQVRRVISNSRLSQDIVFAGDRVLPRVEFRAEQQLLARILWCGRPISRTSRATTTHQLPFYILHVVGEDLQIITPEIVTRTHSLVHVESSEGTCCSCLEARDQCDDRFTS